MNTQNRIWTIGYQGRSIDEFLSILSHNAIDMIIDVRKNPVSRKPGFSKNRLIKNLYNNGIKYVSLTQLGVTTEVRRQIIAEENYTLLREYMDKVLNNNFFLLDSFIKDLKGNNICLLCFENDHQLCHRSIIAQRISHKEDTIICHI